MSNACAPRSRKRLPGTPFGAVDDGGDRSFNNVGIASTLSVGSQAVIPTLYVEDVVSSGDLELIACGNVNVASLELTVSVVNDASIVAGGNVSIDSNAAIYLTAPDIVLDGNVTLPNLNACNLHCNGNMTISATGSISLETTQVYANGNLNANGVGTINTLVVNTNASVGNLLTTSNLNVVNNETVGNLLTTSNLNVTNNANVGNLLTTSNLNVNNNANVGNLLTTLNLNVNNNANVGNLLTTLNLNVNNTTRTSALYATSLPVGNVFTYAPIAVEPNGQVVQTTSAANFWISKNANQVVGPLATQIITYPILTFGSPYVQYNNGVFSFLDFGVYGVTVTCTIAAPFNGYFSLRPGSSATGNEYARTGPFTNQLTTSMSVWASYPGGVPSFVITFTNSTLGSVTVVGGVGGLALQNDVKIVRIYPSA